MDLKTYLKASKKTQTQFATELRPPVTQGVVSQWILGKTRISAERCRDIERATGGRVIVHELRPDIFGRAKSRAVA